jgi:hypothetical protein
MSTHPFSATADSATIAAPTAFSSAVGRLFDEAITLLAALLNPRSVIEEVEAMSALHRRAAALESSDPERAARLRREASRIGLR